MSKKSRTKRAARRIIMQKLGINLIDASPQYIAIEVMAKTGWKYEVTSQNIANTVIDRYWRTFCCNENLIIYRHQPVKPKTVKFSRNTKKERRKTHLQSLPPVPRDGFDRTNWKKQSEAFYKSDEWKQLRYKALQVCGGKCQCCGAGKEDGIVLHVDHVKPRYIYPHLQLEITNVQVLCQDCNVGKGAWDETDWRTEEQRQQLAHMKAL